MKDAQKIAIKSVVGSKHGLVLEVVTCSNCLTPVYRIVLVESATRKELCVISFSDVDSALFYFNHSLRSTDLN